MRNSLHIHTRTVRGKATPGYNGLRTRVIKEVLSILWRVVHISGATACHRYILFTRPLIESNSLTHLNACAASDGNKHETLHFMHGLREPPSHARHVRLGSLGTVLTTSPLAMAMFWAQQLKGISGFDTSSPERNSYQVYQAATRPSSYAIRLMHALLQLCKMYRTMRLSRRLPSGR